MLRSIENISPTKSPTNSPIKNSPNKKQKTQGNYEDFQFQLGMKLWGGENGEPAFKQAFSRFLAAAKQGHAASQMALGECYEKGDGTKQDLAMAAYWYQEAAKQNHANAQYNLALCHFYGGPGLEKNEREAIKWLEEATKNGHASAQTFLGNCFRLGTGVKQNPEKAFFYYECAAKQGHTEAQYELAYCYETENGTQKDLVMAADLYHKAAKQNYTDAQYRYALCHFYGQGVEENKKEAIIWLHKAAVQGHAGAQVFLGDCFRFGIGGVEKNPDRSFLFFESAAEQNYALGQYGLGLCYETGNGVKKDLGRALQWYTKATENGYAEANDSVGLLHACGLGTVKDPEKAFTYFAAGANHGDSWAQCNLGRCYATGAGVMRNDQVAFEWFNESAKKNHPEAKFWVNKNITITADFILDKINQSNEYYLPKQFPPIAEQDGPICGVVSFVNNVNYAKKRQFFPTQNTKKMAGGDISDTNDIVLDQLQSCDSPCKGTNGPIFSVEVFTYLSHHFGLSGCESVLNDPEKDFTEKEYTQLLCEAIQQNYVLTVSCDSAGFMPTLVKGENSHWISLFGYIYDAKGNCNFVGTHKGAYVVWPADGENSLYASTKQIPKLNPHAPKYPADLNKFRLCFFKVKVDDAQREMLVQDKLIADGENKEPDGKINERSLVPQCNT